MIAQWRVETEQACACEQDVGEPPRAIGCGIGSVFRLPYALNSASLARICAAASFISLPAMVLAQSSKR